MPNLSFWENEAWISPQDFIIVGGGLAGLWTAFELKSRFPLAKITILEKEPVSTGASTRNAGFACFGSPTELIADIKTMGEDEVWKVVEMRCKGIEKIRQVIGDKHIDFEPAGGYECYKKVDHDLPGLEQKIEGLNKGFKEITGLENTFKWVNEQLENFGLSGFDAMVQNRLEGGLHSGKLVKALTNLVQQKGVRILKGIQANKWVHSSFGVNLLTTAGQFLTGNLILAANAFTSLICPATQVTPARGQILLTEPIEGLKLKGTFHFDEGFYYFRNVGNRVLIGGARNKAFDKEATTEMETTKTIQAELEAFLARHIFSSRTFSVSHRWSGIMAFTEDKKPLAKEIEPNVHAIICCNGMGVALSPIMAEVLVKEF